MCVHVYVITVNSLDLHNSRDVAILALLPGQAIGAPLVCSIAETAVAAFAVHPFFVPSRRQQALPQSSVRPQSRLPVLLAMAGNHPNAWWQWNQGSDRWDWHANSWWQWNHGSDRGRGSHARRQWGHGNKWRQHVRVCHCMRVCVWEPVAAVGVQCHVGGSIQAVASRQWESSVTAV